MSFTPREAKVCLPQIEREILAAIARGLRDVDIADLVCVTPSAVRKRRRRIEEKLGVRGCGPCVAVAWRLGFLDLASVADELLAKAAPSKVRGAAGRVAAPLEDSPE